MRALRGVVAVATGLCFALTAAADLIHLDAFGAGSATHPRLTHNGERGGEFVVTADGGFGTFLTFCLELQERIGVGKTYHYAVSDASDEGGPPPNQTDPLDFKSAWLYLNYRNGKLDDLVPGYAYGDNASADSLQEAFWIIEQENLPSGAASTLAQGLIDAAAAGSAGWTDLHGVRVFVLTDDAGNNKQDVLALIPAPAAALLGIVGLAGLPALRRRLM